MRFTVEGNNVELRSQSISILSVHNSNRSGTDIPSMDNDVGTLPINTLNRNTLFETTRAFAIARHVLRISVEKHVEIGPCKRLLVRSLCSHRRKVLHDSRAFKESLRVLRGHGAKEPSTGRGSSVNLGPFSVRKSQRDHAIKVTHDDIAKPNVPFRGRNPTSEANKSKILNKWEGRAHIADANCTGGRAGRTGRQPRQHNAVQTDPTETIVVLIWSGLLGRTKRVGFIK